MGLLDSLTALMPFSTPVDAEAAAAQGKGDADADNNNAQAAAADGGDEEPAEEAEEEEEEEDDEPVDPAPALEEECVNSAACKPYKTHYDECALRVEEQTEKFGKPKEDCVEEFFELAHCAGACAAPKLWKQLK